MKIGPANRNANNVNEIVVCPYCGSKDIVDMTEGKKDGKRFFVHCTLRAREVRPVPFVGFEQAAPINLPVRGGS